MSTNETERDDSATETTDASTEKSPTEASPATESPAAEASSSETSSAPPADAEAPATDEPAAAQAPVSDAPKATEAKATDAKATETKAASAAAKSDAALSPGQRLAAQKAAKAAKKATDKATRAADAAAKADEEVAAVGLASRPTPSAPDEVELRAAEVSNLVQKNQGLILRAAALLVVGIAVFGGVRAYLTFREHAAGSVLERAVEASRAEIGEAPEVPDGRPRYATIEARDRATLRLFRKVIAQQPSTEAARYAHLGIASMLLEDEKFDDALRELRAANSGLEDAPGLEAAVTEALGVAYLGKHDYAQATRQFQNLGRIDRRRYRDVADYQLARTLFDRGDRDGAKAKLTALLARLDGENATPAEHAQDQARNLLRQIDPSAVPQPAMPNGLTPELLRMLQQQGLNLGGGQ